MKCLLVIPRWSEQEFLTASTGRPYLDLLLNALGYADIRLLELDPETPFDPNEVPEEYNLVMIQGGSGGRLRRSILSNLGLSLGLDGEESDRLRVVGARPLHDADGEPVGFAVCRKGRLVMFCETGFWALRQEVQKAIFYFRQEDKLLSRFRPMHCWMVEGRCELADILPLLSEVEIPQVVLRQLPTGDTALLFPASMRSEEGRTLLQQALGEALYAMEPIALEDLVFQVLVEKQLTLAVAESCTAGLLAARLTSLAGSSAYFQAGYITYSNESKLLLGVTDSLLERYGAVSQEVALSMARGALRASDADLAVSITGIAGPGGGSAEKPVGTVHLAAVAKVGANLELKGFYLGSRDSVRLQASQTAMHLIRRVLGRSY
ncbi:MAG: nicotinamide-nucleotide amidohydrolase family protein [Magnetococcales bacterium]|nr:nicotinamide-nucleotide amidohydrolase family protein [Magnetococcales bacterium]NGZ25423.1 nicotinamide-nucleotide amidohydrolase family protein [Magnetococcales bacterium]